MKLIIVESPAKAKKIQTFFNKNVIVRSSFGHINGLDTSKLDEMIEKDFKPIYGVEAYFIPSIKEWEVVRDQTKTDKKKKRLKELEKELGLSLKKGGLVAKKKFIAIGCGKVMNNRRKKTKIY